ncbi:MAG: DNRLRE domain-containing protein [Myxococcaceae bacterium]
MRSLAVSLLLFASGAWANGWTHLSLQRGADGGAIDDCYIWGESLDYNGNSDTLYVGLVGTADKETFVHFDLSQVPATAVVAQAWLTLTVTSTSGVEVRAHHASRAWAETEPTWGTFATAFEAPVVARFTPGEGRVVVDVTAAVADWVAGRHPNFGLALEQDPGSNSSTFASSDSPTAVDRPVLDVVFAPTSAPLISEQPPALSASCDVPFTYSLRGHAPLATEFSLAGAEGAVDAQSGLFTWTPSRKSVGTHDFSVQVKDPASRTGQLDFHVDVTCTRGFGVGCSSGVGGAWWLAFLWLARRKKG